MSIDFNGMIESNPGVRIFGPGDEDAVWQTTMDIHHLNNGNARDALACLFGVRNDYGFRPLSENRGLPEDASAPVRSCFDSWGGPADVFGTTWITWEELAAADWDATDGDGTLTLREAAGDTTHWGPVWTVMRVLADLHGPENVRLIVWFS
jgi:hypothetical protein